MATPLRLKKSATAPKPKPTVKKKATPKPTVKKVNPEKMLQDYLKKGMTLDKARQKVLKETGSWANGYTN